VAAAHALRGMTADGERSSLERRRGRPHGALMSHSHARWFAVASALAVTLGGAGCSDVHADALRGIRGVALQPVRGKPDFTLTDTRGQPFRFPAATRGTVTL